jgi:Xaa-Pro aminopeptidase
LSDVHQELLEAIRPGVRACDLFEQCRAGFEKRGLNFRLSHIGHGIGLGLHEFPMLNPLTSQELLPGMVLCIEPLHFDDEGLFHIEDMVQVTDDGVRLLSSSADWRELRTID